MKKAKTFLIIMCILLVLIAGGGIFAGMKISESQLNLPNVYVGNVDVGKLNAEQTVEALKSGGWQARTETPLTVSIPGGQSFTVDPVKTGLILSVEDGAEAAYRYGHEGNIVENLITYVKSMFSAVDVNALNAEADSAYIGGRIDEGLAALKDYMGESEYSVDYKAGELSMKKGWNQLELDRTALAEAIIAAVNGGESSLSYLTISKELKSPDFAGIKAELEKDPADAYYKDDGSFEVIDEIVGCKMDDAQAEKLWTAAEPGAELKIPIDVSFPETTGEELRGRLYRDLLGAMTTKFPNSGEARRSNLKLATSKLDGLILYPGEVMSYNETVGVRTEEAGFLPAPAYVDGDVKDEIGGGACQVSSTLYAASLFAFLESPERECHYFPVNYMQMGTDATVTIPAGGGRSIDYKLKNNKNYPIKLVGDFNNEESILTFEIWGTLEDEDYMPVEFDNTYTWQFDYDRFIDPAYPDREGYKIKLECEIYSFSDDYGSGYRILTHRKVFDSEGNLVEDVIVNPRRGNDQIAMDTYYQH